VIRDWMVSAAGLVLASATLCGAAASQATKSKAAPNGTSVEVLEHGRAVFEKKCAACHYAASTVRKIGPGLKGMSKRGTFLVSGKKVTDESLKECIEKGDDQMPPFKDLLDAAELKDVIRYVKTL
jgi:cytochrome c